ncbi:alanine racemase [Dermabacteraceae bacterium CCM 9519]
MSIMPSRAVVSTSAITNNTRLLHGLLRENTALMAVVKADAYGHGLVRAAKAALAGGATWLGVAHIESALRLREAGIDAPVLAWLWTPDAIDEALPRAIAAGIDLSLGSHEMLAAVQRVARQLGKRARVHVKLDTGMGRNGVPADGVARLARMLAAASREVEVVGAWSHLATADEPDGEAVVNAQARAFNTACEQLSANVGPLQLRHLANSAATLTRPDLHFEMVRCGLAIYGYAPLPCDLPLVPALTLESSLALVKQVPAGQGVSYGHRYVCPSDSLLGIVPLGYADGLHRAASGKMSVIVHARSGSVMVPQRGRICMDQIVVDLSTVPDAAAGDRVTVFGPGELTAKHLAAAAGTIDYEILTSLSTRVPRVESEA